MIKTLPFQPKARLILQLGDQLIRNESIALLELIKNSYDAYATIVNVSMKNIQNVKSGEIIIQDNGEGMDSSIIENVWMQPGSDNKLKLLKNFKKTSRILRLPIGEKGIGRFGVHKLGYQIELVSKMKNSNEVRLNIDWSEFEKNDLLINKKIRIIEEQIPKVFTNDRTGTRLIIKRLRQTWDRNKIRDLYRAITSLSSPFKGIDSFKVNFRIDKIEWLKGLLKFENVEKYALYYALINIKDSKIVKLN